MSYMSQEYDIYDDVVDDEPPFPSPKGTQNGAQKHQEKLNMSVCKSVRLVYGAQNENDELDDNDDEVSTAKVPRLKSAEVAKALEDAVVHKAPQDSLQSDDLITLRGEDRCPRCIGAGRRTCQVRPSDNTNACKCVFCRDNNLSSNKCRVDPVKAGLSEKEAKAEVERREMEAVKPRPIRKSPSTTKTKRQSPRRAKQPKSVLRSVKTAKSTPRRSGRAMASKTAEHDSDASFGESDDNGDENYHEDEEDEDDADHEDGEDDDVDRSSSDEVHQALSQAKSSKRETISPNGIKTPARMRKSDDMTWPTSYTRRSHKADLPKDLIRRCDEPDEDAYVDDGEDLSLQKSNASTPARRQSSSTSKRDAGAPRKSVGREEKPRRSCTTMTRQYVRQPLDESSATERSEDSSEDEHASDDLESPASKGEESFATLRSHTESDNSPKSHNRESEEEAGSSCRHTKSKRNVSEVHKDSKPRKQLQLDSDDDDDDDETSHVHKKSKHDKQRREINGKSSSGTKNGAEHVLPPPLPQPPQDQRLTVLLLLGSVNTTNEIKGAVLSTLSQTDPGSTAQFIDQVEKTLGHKCVTSLLKLTKALRAANVH